MIVAILQLIVVQFILPAYFIYSLWRGKYQSRLEWILHGLLALLIISWGFFSSPWSWFSYYLRFVWVLLFMVVFIISWRKARELSFMLNDTGKQKLSLGISVLLIGIFGMYNVWVFSGFSTNEQAIELDFPLKDGWYYVGQGGNHVQLNYHQSYPEQKYALDVLKLNQFGMRATGIYPEQLSKYEIYEDTLYSPCTGEIIEARNDLPDLAPPKAEPKNPEGNYVKINCKNENTTILIAHMKKRSILVEAGDAVKTGQPIGLVGNSGNTTEPHLHIHAEKDGKGVPIRFDGKFLVRNSLVW